MPDLVIGGNTYKNKTYVRIKKADGKDAIFYDSARKDHKDMVASLTTFKAGEKFNLSAILQSRSLTASLVKESE